MFSMVSLHGDVICVLVVLLLYLRRPFLWAVVRRALVQAGHGGHHGEREGLSQAHQDVGAVWNLHEDPQRPQEVSLHELHLCSMSSPKNYAFFPVPAVSIWECFSRMHV